MSRIRILLVTRSATVADAVSDRLRGNSKFSVTQKIISNGHSDPLHNVPARQDVLLLHYIPGYGELEHLAEAAVSKRLPLIVLGPATTPTLCGSQCARVPATTSPNLCNRATCSVLWRE